MNFFILQVIEWSAEEVYYLLESIITCELKAHNSRTDVSIVTTNASSSMKSHGYIKTPLQCQDQWLYILNTFRFGGYRQFINQLKQLYLISPSVRQLYLSQISLQQESGSSKGSPQRTESPQIKVQSVQHESDCTQHTTVKVHTKKINSDIPDLAVLTVSEEDWERKKNKNSAPGDVISYVQVNVPRRDKPSKRHVQVATDEIECSRICEAEEEFKASFEVKREPLDSEPSSTVQDSADHSSMKRKRSLPERLDIQPTSANKTAFCKLSCDSGGKQNDTVQVEILSVTDTDKAKVVECKTVSEFKPARLIRLHYPTDYSLPTSLKHMNIPMIMVYPDIMATGKQIKLSHPSEDNQFTDGKTSIDTLKHEIEVNASRADDDSTNISKLRQDKREILHLLNKYRLECDQDEDKWLAMLDTHHQQQMSALQRALSLFKELQDFL